MYTPKPLTPHKWANPSVSVHIANLFANPPYCHGDLQGHIVSATLLSREPPENCPYNDKRVSQDESSQLGISGEPAFFGVVGGYTCAWLTIQCKWNQTHTDVLR